MTIDGQKLTQTLLGGVVLAIVLGAASAYRDSVRMATELSALTAVVQELKVEVVKVRDAAHTHGGNTRMYLPDAEPED